jgi:hypothetical protein
MSHQEVEMPQVVKLTDTFTDPVLNVEARDARHASAKYSSDFCF